MGAFGSASAFPSLNPGDLRHRIEFLTQTISSGLSGSVVTWTKCVPSVWGWAKIEATRGADVFRAGQETSQVFLTLSMWYNPGVYATQHILSSTGAEYVILSVENVLQMNHIMIIYAQAVGAQANQGG